MGQNWIPKRFDRDQGDDFAITLFHPKLSAIFLGDTVDEAGPSPLIGKTDNSEPRFFCQKQANLQWTVWDRVTDRPASLGGRDLVGCTYYRANAAASVLTQIYAHGLEAGATAAPVR